MFPRQHYEVYARLVTQGAAGPVEGSVLLQAFTGGPEAEQQARDVWTRAGAAMKADDHAEWYTAHWTEVVLLGPNGQMDGIKRDAPKEDGAE